VEDSLSANQQRARFVAKDIHEYTRSVPAGRVIKSSELRRVLSAKKEGRIHTETVSRVIDFLTDLGQDDVQVRETQQGERVVVFTDKFVKRVVAYHNTNHSVVREGGATG
jgi:predicted transcriptional regulator